MGMEVDDFPPSSPPLPALLVPPSRKRQLSEFDSNFSSDPLFSEATTDSDDAAGCEGPRRKRMVRGPWWNPGKRPQRDGSALNEDARNVDSGVWMGSDSSVGSSASLLSNQRRLQALRMTSTSTSSTPSMATKSKIAPVDGVRRLEQVAETIVNQCVEEGNEKVDLSQMQLQRLSSETLRPLHQLIRHAHISTTEPPSEDQFRALTPELQLFLAGNELTSLPSELFQLENMVSLQTRQFITRRAADVRIVQRCFLRLALLRRQTCDIGINEVFNASTANRLRRETLFREYSIRLGQETYHR